MISENTLNLYLKAAEKYWQEENYDNAIKYYKKYLRINPKNANVWIKLGVCYYQSGQIEKAKKILTKFYSKSSQDSFGSFYLGSLYLLLNDVQQAKTYLRKAAYYNDNYADKSTYELVVIFYNEKNVTKTLEWIKFYKNKFSKGAFINQIKDIENALAKGDINRKFEGNPKPDIEGAAYKYNKFSLFNYPHYWVLQLGFDSKDGLTKDPDPSEKYGLKDRPYSMQGLIINTGVGVGPIKKQGAVSWAGYHYKQHWLSTPERFETWTKDYTDLDYFPFRSDLLERTHDIYATTYKEIESFFVSVLFELEFVRIGSNYMPAQGESTPIQQTNTSVSRSVLVLPEIGIKYEKYFETLLFLYLKRELNDEMPEFSFKTYNFTSSDIGLSLGIRQKVYVPRYKLESFADLYYFDITFNDPWLSKKSIGAYVQGEIEFLPNIFIKGGLGYYNDIYKLKILKQIRCNGISNEDIRITHDSTEPIYCMRTDVGMNYGLGLYWIYNDSIKAEFNIMGKEVKNEKQIVYDRTENIFMFVVTAAFPSIKKYEWLTKSKYMYAYIEDKN